MAEKEPKRQELKEEKIVEVVPEPAESPEEVRLSDEELKEMERQDEKYVQEEIPKLKGELDEMFNKGEKRSLENGNETEQPKSMQLEQVEDEEKNDGAISKDEIIDLLGIEEGEELNREKLLDSLDYLRDELENNSYTNERALARLAQNRKFLSRMEELARGQGITNIEALEGMLKIEESEDKLKKQKSELEPKLEEGKTKVGGEKKESENLEKMDREELEGLKNSFSNLADEVRILGIKLTERDREGLSPLIDPKNIGRLKVSESNLESVINDRNIKGEHLGEAVSEIIRAIDTIGKVDSRMSTIKDKEKSLKEISLYLGNIQDKCSVVSGKIRSINKKEAEDIDQLVGKLKSKITDRIDYLNRKITAFRRYNS